MINKKGILNEKLKTYYSDVDLKNYRTILFEAMSKYKGTQFNNILDIGSGVGSFIEGIREFGFNCYALEGSEYGYKTCISKGINCKKFLLGENNKLPFKDGMFSFVLMNQVIEHLDENSGKYYISEIYRVLEKGGVGIIKSPSRYSIIWNTDPNHVYCWKPFELYNEALKVVQNKEDLYLDRIPLELWMLSKYNENTINVWHKYNKYPLIKRILYLMAKILDRVISKIIKTDRLLATSNITFVKGK